jgi:hypothetical protein
MPALQVKLIPAFGALALVWLGVALYVVITRTIYDVRHAGAVALARFAQRGVTRGDTVDGLARRLPLRTLERVAADTSTERPSPRRSPA